MRKLAVLAAAGAVSAGGVLAATTAARTPPPTTASNRQAAIADAKQLLAGVVPPAGAALRSSGTAVAPHAYLLTTLLASAVAYAKWNVPGDPATVLSAVEAHLPAGSTLVSWGDGGPIPGDQSVIRSWPAVHGVLGVRWLRLEVASAASGGTVLQAKSQSQWIVTRSPRERIPSGVDEVEVTSGWPGKAPFLSLRVLGRAKVHRLVSLFNSLGIDQPAVLSCPAGIVTPTVNLRFRARERTVAEASLDATGTPSACFPIRFTILGRSGTPLVGNVITPIQRLLHVKLAPRG